MTLCMTSPGRQPWLGTTLLKCVFRSIHYCLAIALSVSAVATAAQQPSAPVQRIVSLAPNLTELTYAAGAGDRLVGVDSISDYPPAARQLPRVGDAFQVDFERVVALKPDVILVWDTGTPERVVERLQRLGLDVRRVQIANLQDIGRALRFIGALVGTSSAAEQAARAYLQQVEQLRASRGQVERLRVFYQISESPLYTVNGRHLISEVIALCGGRNIFSELEQLAPPVSPEAVLERDPQVIMTASGAQGDPLAVWQRWPNMRAVRSGNLYTINADLLARATPRIVAGAREVCAALDRARART